MKTAFLLTLVAATLVSTLTAAPKFLTYSGRVGVGDKVFTGTGQFRFSLFDVDTVALLWNHDGSVTIPPTGAVSLAVTKGVFSVILGDATVPGMVALPAGLFEGRDHVVLRVWFNDGVNGWEKFSPDYRLTASPTAFQTDFTELVFDGAVDADGFGLGAVGGLALQADAVTSGKLANDAVTNTKLTNDSVALDHFGLGAVTGAKLQGGAGAIAAAAEGIALLPVGAGLFSTDPNDAGLTAEGFVRTGDAMFTSGEWTVEEVSLSVPSAIRQAVWIEDEMVVWGGTPVMPQRGRRYFPASDRWESISNIGGPTSNVGSPITLIWTGTDMITWGGTTSNIDGIYNKASETWRPVSTVAAPPRSTHHTTVWTGSEMIVFGGFEAGTAFKIGSGGRYNPATDSWVGLPGLTPRVNHSAVWTGTEMLMWGGSEVTSTNTGWRYDPVGGFWLGMTTVGAPAARSSHCAVWTGDRMLIWGNATTPDGGSYDPLTNTWSPIATLNQPAARNFSSCVWTGTEFIVWGGDRVGRAPARRGPIQSGHRHLDRDPGNPAQLSRWQTFFPGDVDGNRNDRVGGIPLPGWRSRGEVGRRALQPRHQHLDTDHSHRNPRRSTRTAGRVDRNRAGGVEWIGRGPLRRRLWAVGRHVDRECSSRRCDQSGLDLERDRTPVIWRRDDGLLLQHRLPLQLHHRFLVCSTGHGRDPDASNRAERAVDRNRGDLLERSRRRRVSLERKPLQSRHRNLDGDDDHRRSERAASRGVPVDRDEGLLLRGE